MARTKAQSKAAPAAEPKPPVGLPFKTAPKVETVEVGNDKIGQLELPKRYSLTPNEEMAFAKILAVNPDVRERSQFVTYQVRVATLALKRIRPEQTEAETGELNHLLVAEIYDYFMSERRQWEPIPDVNLEGDTDPKAPSTGESTTATSASTSPKSTTD